MDIIYFTLFPWENAYSSVSLSFTREFCKNHRVFYINHPYSIKDYFSKRDEPLAKSRSRNLFRNQLTYEKIDELPENVIAVHPPMTFPINWMSDNFLYKNFSKYNHQVIVNTVKQVIKDFKIEDYIFLNCYNPFHGGVMPEELKPKLNIYQCIDDMTQEAYCSKHGARLEEKAISAADIATFTSIHLHKIKSHLNPNSYVIHNAVDLSIFRNAVEVEYPKPKEIEGLNKRIIGFTGNLDPDRLDYGLIKKVAQFHQDKMVVIVGPLNSNGHIEFGLDKEPNIIFTGGKHIRELPAYLQHFDVTIIPFQCNKLTQSIYPLKINEYLASGKPVISTNFSEDIRQFQDLIYLSDNEASFLENINKAIAEDSSEKLMERTKVAEANTWTARVNQFWEMVEMHLETEKTKVV